MGFVGDVGERASCPLVGWGWFVVWYDTRAGCPRPVLFVVCLARVGSLRILRSLRRVGSWGGTIRGQGPRKLRSVGDGVGERASCPLVD